MIDHQTFMKSTKGDRQLITSEIKTENLYWIGEICKKKQVKTLYNYQV